MEVILFLGCLCLLFFVFRKKENKENIVVDSYSNKIYSQKELMTNFEKYFYDILIELESELDVRIHPQINLATIIKKEINNHYINELFRNIDFAIFDKDYKKVLLLIEINDKTHSSKKRMARDIKVERIINQAGIKLIKFYSNYPNKKEYIKDRIKKEIISISNLEF